MIALLPAVTLLLALSARPAPAADYGSTADIATIRHDVPILVKYFLPNDAITIGQVNVNGDTAYATFAIAGGLSSEVFTLRRKAGRWWYVSGSLVGEACARCQSYLYSDTDGYQARLHLELNDSYVSLIMGLHGRAPPEADMNPAAGKSTLYDFEVLTDATTPLPVAGGTLDVWFPFVLDPDRHYALTLDAAGVGIPGTLHDNTLTFVLPKFAVPAGRSVRGEIEGHGVSEKSAPHPSGNTWP
jgi:hypothetical protein